MNRSIVLMAWFAWFVIFAACTREVTVEVPVEVLVTPTPKPLEPIPGTVQGPAIPQGKGYFVEELGDGLYWATEGAYQNVGTTEAENPLGQMLSDTDLSNYLGLPVPPIVSKRRFLASS